MCDNICVTCQKSTLRGKMIGDDFVLVEDLRKKNRDLLEEMNEFTPSPLDVINVFTVCKIQFRVHVIYLKQCNVHYSCQRTLIKQHAQAERQKRSTVSHKRLLKDT